MQALNKKLAEKTQKILNQIEEKSLSLLSILTVSLIFFGQIDFIDNQISSTLAITVFIIALTANKKTSIIITGLTGISLLIVLNISQIIGVTTLLASIIILYKILEKTLAKMSLFVIANLGHLGDALTTYIGLQKGLEEKNPLLAPILEATEYYYIFPIKLLVTIITIYIYFKMEEREKIILFKLIFLIGLYLTAGNLVNLL